MQAAEDAGAGEDCWYVLKNGQKFGPVTSEDLKAYIAGGRVHRTDLVWRRGLHVWTAVNEIPSLALAQSGSLPSPNGLVKFPPVDSHAMPPSLRLVQADAPRRAVSMPASYFARHWRGDLSLVASFWVNGCFGYVLIAVVNAFILASSNIGEKFRPGLALAAAGATWLVTAAAVTWLVTGAWRSATRHQRTPGGGYWAGITKLVLIACAGRTVIAFIQTGAPQLRELYQIYAGDERVGKYAFRVLRDGRELEFSGGIPFGAAADFERFINAMGSVKLIHLNSDGGRISEAQLMARIIRQRNLNTYVPNRCLSACTIVFLSGRERLIAPQGRLGFHQPDFPGITAEERQEAIAAEEKRLRQFGLSEEFARKANMALPSEMWIPSVPELVKEGVVTQVVNAFDYALSGFGENVPTREEVEKILLANDTYKSLRAVSPESYEKILDKFESGLRRGLSISDLRSEISPIILQKYDEILPFTSEDNLLSFARIIIKHSTLYNRADPAMCYFNLNPDKSTPGAVLNLRQRYKDLAEEEDVFMSQIFKSYSGKTAKIPQQKDVSRSVDHVMATLSRRKDVEVGLLTAADIPADKYGRYCDSVIAMYEETLRLPRKEAAMLIRFFVGSK